MKAVVVHNHPIHYKHLLFSELHRQGLDFEVIFLGGQSSMRHEQIRLSAELYRSHIAWPGFYETAPLNARTTFTWRKLSELDPEIVIISGYYAAECWAAWLWALIEKRPIVLWFESNEFDCRRHWPMELVKRMFCSQVDRAHVYGSSNRQYLVKLGIPGDRIDLKRAVVDVEHFGMNEPRPRRDERRPICVLSIGRLAPEKNISFLLRAYAKSLHERGASAMRLLIAGSGPCETALKSEAFELGISEQVEFLGYVSCRIAAPLPVRRPLRSAQHPRALGPGGPGGNVGATALCSSRRSAVAPKIW